MSHDEACVYIGISSDAEDLDIDRIEKNYRTKLAIYDPSRFEPDTPEHKEARRMRRNIEQAYRYLLELYDESSDDYTPSSTHSLLRITALTTTIAALSLAAFIWLAYSEAPDDKRDPANPPARSQDYERLLQEVERLRALTEAANPNPSSSTPDYADVVERVMPAIVMIKTDVGTGSGFFVSSKGEILTNFHVIRDATHIAVTPRGGRPSTALLKDYDSTKDIALLKVNASNSPYLRISGELPRQGEAVMAVGNPRGYEGTVSNGIISAFRQNNTWIQFTAPISPGSSGGALINMRGEVVGMPTKLRTDGQNLNFAIAPDVLRKFFNNAKDKPAMALTVPASDRADDYAGDEIDEGAVEAGLRFVKSDESFEMYIETDHIDYDPEGGTASFVSVWFPTPSMNAKMKKDPNFHAVRGKDFGACMLVYIADFSNGTYKHLRTVNLYTDGTTARDYIKPKELLKWERPSRGSRIEAIMEAVRKQLAL